MTNITNTNGTTCEHCGSRELEIFSSKETLARTVESIWNCNNCGWKATAVYRLDRITFSSSKQDSSNTILLLRDSNISDNTGEKDFSQFHKGFPLEPPIRTHSPKEMGRHMKAFGK